MFLKHCSLYNINFKFNKYYDHSLFQTLEDFVYECLKTADQNGLKSIAFPALGTGNLGYPADLVASTMYQAVQHFERIKSDTSVEEVMFVVFYKDHPTVAVSAFFKVKRYFLRH